MTRSGCRYAVCVARRAEVEVWDAPVLSAFLPTFFGSLAMSWIYGTSGKDGSATITPSTDPGLLGAYFHYVHAVIVAGIIATAIGNGLVIAYPDGRMPHSCEKDVRRIVSRRAGISDAEWLIRQPRSSCPLPVLRCTADHRA
ncbi:low temperature requirement protein A [Methylobacterium sp. BTF04]|uniref:low temperature requirement protein A n=1 Tax=Methylobacterium sp. BTF04 TaxID=2708300 RepID=UPI0032B2E1DD